MKIIKELVSSDFKLIHLRFVDFTGMLVDGFELVNTEERISIPFRGDMKVSDYKKSEPISTTTDYTDEEYKDMLDKQIKKYLNKTQ